MSIEISDHAVLRYIERVHGIDVEQIKNSIADSIDDGLIRFSKGNEVRYKAKDCTFVIRNNIVITAIKN